MNELEQGEPVAWGLFGKVAGKWEIQHPVRFTEADAEADKRMYAKDTELRVSPLYAGSLLASIPPNTPVEAGKVGVADGAGEVSDEAEFELHCDGDYEASAIGPREEAWREIQHYAAQYQQDGPVVIYEVKRTPVPAHGPESK